MAQPGKPSFGMLQSPLKKGSMINCNIVIVWSQYGPYHYARLGGAVEVFRKLGTASAVTGLEVSDTTTTYAWTKPASMLQVEALFNRVPVENIRARDLFMRWVRYVANHRNSVYLLPSYWPVSSAMMLLICKIMGCSCVMMNESHAGTERAKGAARVVKTWLIQMFDSGLVGGSMQIEYFARMGLSRRKLHIGYDVIDSQYFERCANEVRVNRENVLRRWKLPDRYFLNIGRFEPKKNLLTLIRAYARFARQERWAASTPMLVLVGAGSCESEMRSCALDLGLDVFNEMEFEPGSARRPGVLFYGFKQIDVLPDFYALATAFVLPSIYEEWGLVVNESIACGVPVLVSSAVGSAYDLVRDGNCGLLFDPSDEVKLSKCLLEVASNEASRAEMVKSCGVVAEKWGVELFGRGCVSALRSALDLRSGIVL